MREPTLLDYALSLVDETNPRDVRERDELLREHHATHQAETEAATARTDTPSNRAPVQRRARGRPVRPDSPARPS